MTVLKFSIFVVSSFHNRHTGENIEDDGENLSYIWGVVTDSAISLCVGNVATLSTSTMYVFQGIRMEIRAGFKIASTVFGPLQGKY